MPSRFACPVVDAAEEDLRRAVERIIDLILDTDPFIAREATDRLGWLAYLVTDMILAAYPRTEMISEREHLIYALGCVAPRWHSGINSFLSRVAREDLNDGIRRQAEETLRYRKTSEGFGVKGFDSALESDDFDDLFDIEAEDGFLEEVWTDEETCPS